jgi:hypothetical protein
VIELPLKKNTTVATDRSYSSDTSGKTFPVDSLARRRGRSSLPRWCSPTRLPMRGFSFSLRAPLLPHMASVRLSHLGRPHPLCCTQKCLNACGQSNRQSLHRRRRKNLLVCDSDYWALFFSIPNFKFFHSLRHINF